MITYMSAEAFTKYVRQVIQETIREEMLKDFQALKETMNGSKPGDDDPSNTLVPGTNLNINQALEAASKEKDFKKKAELTAKITNQLASMKESQLRTKKK